MQALDLVLSASQADHEQQLRQLVGGEVRYHGQTWRVLEAMGEGERFGLFLQQTHAVRIPMVQIVSGDDLRGVQLP